MAARKVVCIGGGPAGLYFSILAKKLDSDLTVEVYERNRADDTFGWGVVFSEETISNFQEADEKTYQAIRDSFVYWGGIRNFYRDECVLSTGHGFSGLARKKLLQILQERARELGVALHFEVEIEGLERFADADLIVAADGLNSAIRDQRAEHFKPSLDWRACKFCWLGTTLPMDAFTFIFRENEHGLFRVHAYPFEEGLGTFIVECREDTWRRAGLDEATEEQTVAYFAELFSDHLDGHPLLTNRSIWRTFPTVKCETWHHENIVLLGDSAHTAHFSIGSGTKLAMEDAIVLRDVFAERGFDDVPAALAAYEDARWVDVIKLQKAAQTSLEWFENTERYTDQGPLEFCFNLMTRSKRITYDNLALRDPELVARVAADFAERNGVAPASDGSVPVPSFAPLQLRDVTVPNRIAVSPMCQYSARDGAPNDWHFVHLGSRAVGGAGILFTEMTNVSAQGRITLGCTGLYEDGHAQEWKRVVEFCRANSNSVLAVQLGHAGRKGSCHLPWEGDAPLRDDTAWETLGPSALPFDEGWPTPREMDREDMDRVVGEYVRATSLAAEAGFDMVEIHMAHGYLLSSFLSPASNRRTDDYGGSLENRMRFPLEVFDAVRARWDASRPVAVRISATDWLPEGEGVTIEESVEIARVLTERGCDLIDVSSAGNTPASEPEYGRMYQVPFADRIRHEVGCRVMAVGAILGVDHANTILAAGRADICAMARPHLVNPYLVLGASATYEYPDQRWPLQYLPAAPKPKTR